MRVIKLASLELRRFGFERLLDLLVEIAGARDILSQPDKAAVEAKMRPHILAEATLIRTYDDFFRLPLFRELCT